MILLQHRLGSNCFFNDRFKREPFLKENFVVAGIPVRSGNADLTASWTQVCSAVEVQCVLGESDFLKEVSDSSDVMPESCAILVQGCARDCAVLRELLTWVVSFLVLEQELILAYALTMLRRDRAAELFGARVVILLLLPVFVLQGQELTLAYAALVQFVVGVRRQAMVDR